MEVGGRVGVGWGEGGGVTKSSPRQEVKCGASRSAFVFQVSDPQEPNMSS